MSRRLLVTAVIAAGALALPAAASAAPTITLSFEGAPAPLPANGATLRAPNPDAIANLDSKTWYRFVVLGPQGQSVVSSNNCDVALGPEARKKLVFWVGNGSYTAVLKTYGPDDNDCAGAGVEQRATFTINTVHAIAAPNPPINLTRQPGTFTRIEQVFPIDLAPAASYEAVYALNATLNPDGSIAAGAQPAFVDRAAGAVKLSTSTPGTYTVAIRPKMIGPGFSNAFGPWASAKVTLLTPFDISGVSLLDSRGPSYQLRGRLFEAAATGTVKVAVAKGKNGKRFRSLGTAKIRAGVFTKRFKIRRSGRYRMRFSFAGSPVMAPGTAYGGFRVTRRFVSIPR